MTEPKWTGDLNDDCILKTRDGYVAHAEAMDDDEWYCQVTHENEALTSTPLSPMRTVFHSTEHDVRPLTGVAARALCEVMIDADRWRELTKGKWID